MARPPATAPLATAPRARIRMYRQGLGDCFLVTIGSGRKAYRILIDCGVIQGTPDAKLWMERVAKDIHKETGGKIDLLIATHEHYDHLSGFALAEEAFRKLSVKEVWLGWTEDPDDPRATALVKERDDAVTALAMGVSRLQLEAAPAAVQAESLFSFFGARPGVTKQALEVVRSLTPKPRYMRPTDAPHELTDGTRIYALGPPLDEKLLRKSSPSKGQAYGHALGVMAADVSAIVGGAGESPFGPNYAIPMQVALQQPFFRERYLDPAEARQRIEDGAAADVSQLALKLDSDTNNTSLVVAIELPGGDVMLFAADAQIGSWLSWPDLSWDTSTGKVTGKDLLQRTVVYKVGHHGSHNATLKPNGLELMDALRFALLPVDQDMAVKKRWGKMPLPDIVTELEARTTGKIIRIDQPVPAGAAANVISDELYHELSI